jgi:hypothetical protein
MVRPAIAASFDAGGFYCEHALFASLEAARRFGTAGGTASKVGFLHVPDDEPAYARPGPRPTEVTLGVLARMLRPFHERGRSSRILLTGFGPFASVVDNPTGALVADVAAMRHLVSRLEPSLPPTVIPIAPSATGGLGSRLVVGAGALEIVAIVLPVRDESIDPASSTSIFALHEALRPTAALALGVVADGDTTDLAYRVELCATDRNLVTGATWRHVVDRPPTVLRPAVALRHA